MKLASSPLKVSLYQLLTSFIFSCELQQYEVQPVITQDVHTYSTSLAVDCSTCTYIVPERMHIIDGNVLGLKPGAVICLNSATIYKNLLFKNINGTAEQPIVIKNCGGTAVI